MAGILHMDSDIEDNEKNRSWYRESCYWTCVCNAECLPQLCFHILNKKNTAVCLAQSLDQHFEQQFYFLFNFWLLYLIHLDYAVKQTFIDHQNDWELG